PFHVQGLFRLPHHAEQQLAVDDERLDRADPWMSGCRDRAHEAEPGSLEPLLTEGGQLGRGSFELPPIHGLMLAEALSGVALFRCTWSIGAARGPGRYDLAPRKTEHGCEVPNDVGPDLLDRHPATRDLGQRRHAVLGQAAGND